MTDRKYQVFVSSTFDDLREERRSIMEVILSMGHIPAGMELFSASNSEQWEIIKERIEECDYYIVVIAQRYGSLADEDISYTRKEYEYAREIEIPVAGFVLHPDTAKSWPLEKCEPERSKELEDFRKRIQSLPVDFWTDEGDLKAKCAVALPKLIRKNPRPGWVSGAHAIDAKVATEMVRLSSESTSLRARVTELEDELSRFVPAIDLESLEREMQEISYKLQIKFDYDDAERECEEIDLLSLFKAAAPSLLIENSVKGMRRAFLNASAQASEHRKTDKGIWMDLNVTQGELVVADLAAGGLIEPSIKKRSLRDHHQYWKLTSPGNQLLGSIVRGRPKAPTKKKKKKKKASKLKR